MLAVASIARRLAQALPAMPVAVEPAGPMALQVRWRK